MTTSPKTRRLLPWVALAAVCLTARGGSAFYDFNTEPPLQFVLS
jgi:hypothetical protein